MEGVDIPVPDSTASSAVAPVMKTKSDVLIIASTSAKDNPAGKLRPTWMNDGTFLVFRKLKQDVEAFRNLTDTFATYGWSSKEQMGAKLMGRWQSGKCWSRSLGDQCRAIVDHETKQVLQ